VSRHSNCVNLPNGRFVSSNRDDDLPSSVSVLDIADCGGDLAERESAANRGPPLFPSR
jgi:hypothetical protein